MCSIRPCILFWLLIGICTQYGQCCGPAEIGQKYTIISTADVLHRAQVVWQISSNVLFDSEPNYYQESTAQNHYPDLYTGTTKQLTILNVTKNDGIEAFQHLVNNDIVYNCSLPVYKRASTPTCEFISLMENQLRTKCTTAQVYPQATCQFTLQNGGTERKVISDGASYITYTHTNPQPEGNEYNSTSCTLQYPVDGLKPGNWTVQVNMYPDLTGVSLAQGTVGRAANTLPLSVSAVNISSNTCPKGLAGEGDSNVKAGYIRQGGRASCLCTRDHAGNPPGNISWSSTKVGSFTIVSQREDAVTIQINSSDTFTCQSTSVLDGSNSMTYTPKYAYGPTSAFLTFQSSGPIYLCPNQQTKIDITCQVPANSFNPAPLFTIQDGDSNNLVTKVAGDTAMSKSVNYNFIKSGQHIFTCKVENAVFTDIYSEALTRAIQVYAPPNSPPSFQVRGQSVIADNSGTWVKQGSNISVACSVGQAYPVVSSVKVTCGQETSSSGQLSVPGVSGYELVCKCAVDHETKNPCNGLNLNEQMTIQTAYGPNEVTISLTDDQLREVPDSHLNLCSSEGLDVTVICAVKQFDVRPGLTIADFTLITPYASKLEYYLDLSGGRDYRYVNKLKVTSGGSHTLVCEARNPKFSDIKQTQAMTIEVREPPKDAPKISARSRQHGDILAEGDDVTVTCSVSGGYPSVQSVTLTCGQEKSVTSNETTAQLTLSKIERTCTAINCTCQATHVTGCYDLKSVLPLTVVSSDGMNDEDQSPYTTADLLGAVVGAIVGILVLEAAIALTVFCIRREKAKRKNRNTDKAYDEIEKPPALPYQNVQPRDSSYMTINSTGHTPSSKGESVGQTAGSTNDPNEPDPSAYSEIQE